MFKNITLDCLIFYKSTYLFVPSSILAHNWLFVVNLELVPERSVYSEYSTALIRPTERLTLDGCRVVNSSLCV